MKTAPSILLLFFILFLSCQNKTSKIEYYKGSSKDLRNIADLKLITNKNKFTGDLVITYFDHKKDSGTIIGSVFGDTLKARYSYLSRNRSHFVKPIVFLKRKNQLILGSGEIANYMNIPFYIDSTIQFQNPEFILNKVKN